MLAGQSFACNNPNVYKVHDKSQKYNTTSTFSIMELNFQTLSLPGGSANHLMHNQTADLCSSYNLQHVYMITFSLAQLVAKVSMLDHQGVKMVSEFGKKWLYGLNGRIVMTRVRYRLRAGPSTICRRHILASFRRGDFLSFVKSRSIQP